jgi:glycosyltransferase involved in cell wall biosynthesis
MSVWTLVFAGSVAFIAYAYAGYPLALVLLAALRGRPVRRAEVHPSVSFIIAAHNEGKRIRAKIENTLEQTYESVEVIVASDCSTDDTDEIARSFAPKGVRLVRAPSRNGKEAAQGLAVKAASGDVLVFSDSATRLHPEAVSTIVRNFADPTVGCVSSVDRVLDDQGRVSPEGVYMRYEMAIRNLESRVNSLVGLSGSFFAARREVCRQWAPDLQSDFNTVLNSMRIGLRGVADPDSIGYYPHGLSEGAEFSRKARTILRGITVLVRNRALMNPFRQGLFAWQLFSHKLCKWLVPFAMIGALVGNAALLPRSPFYAVALAAQVAFYLLGLVGLRAARFGGGQAFKIPAFFLLSNLSILVAWLRYARGDRVTSWTPSRRGAS